MLQTPASDPLQLCDVSSLHAEALPNVQASNKNCMLLLRVHVQGTCVHAGNVAIQKTSANASTSTKPHQKSNGIGRFRMLSTKSLNALNTPVTC